MKKFVSLMLAFVLACMLIPSLAEETDVTGEWHLTELLVGGESMNPAVVGMNITMVLNADGTAAMISNYGDEPETTEATWTPTDGGLTLTADDMPGEFIMEDGKLKSDIGDGILVFSREAPTAEALPQVIAAESEEDFIGDWTLTSIGMEVGLVPASMFGTETTMTIEPGKVTTISGDASHESASEFVDGTLKFSDGLDGEIVLELNDNGWISITNAIDEETVMIMYYEKAVEEE